MFTRPHCRATRRGIRCGDVAADGLGHRGRRPRIRWICRSADPPLGFVAAYTYRLDPSGDEFITASVWTDRDTYVRSSSRERQQRWIERVHELLIDDPQTSDGEVIHSVNVRRGNH
ncbi:MAG: hypothetical protein E6I76_04735 [Chloroflexi bacterium]|nr:MAG: hypothetical protein E6I76_04735 [Chloroflexota bacterium]